MCTWPDVFGHVSSKMKLDEVTKSWIVRVKGMHFELDVGLDAAHPEDIIFQNVISRLANEEV